MVLANPIHKASRMYPISVLFIVVKSLTFFISGTLPHAELSVRDPYRLAKLHKASRIYPISVLLIAVKSLTFFISGTLPHAGLSVRDPYRLAKLHEALRMYPSFALVVVVKSREGTGMRHFCTFGLCLRRCACTPLSLWW